MSGGGGGSSFLSAAAAAAAKELITARLERDELRRWWWWWVGNSVRSGEPMGGQIDSLLARHWSAGPLALSFGIQNPRGVTDPQSSSHLPRPRSQDPPVSGLTAVLAELPRPPPPQPPPPPLPSLRCSSLPSTSPRLLRLVFSIREERKYPSREFRGLAKASLEARELTSARLPANGGDALKKNKQKKKT